MKINEITDFSTTTIDKRSVSLQVKDAELITTIDKKCSDALAAFKQGHIIYKGFEGLNNDYYLTDPTAQTRKSKNTSNYYTLLIDNLPAWKGYPKRSQSLICSTNINKASVFGTTYIVFPFNGSRIGICPDRDMWATMFDKYVTMQELNEYYEDAMASDTNLNDFIFGIFEERNNIADEMANSKSGNMAQSTFPDELYGADSEEDIRKIFEKWYSPTRLKFTLTTTKNYPSDNHREVWTDGKSILIKYGSPVSNALYRDR